jgi:hypothetical protein
MVIIIAPELEFDDAESWEAVAPILAGLSLLTGSADPGDEAPPKNNKTARTEAKHRNLTTRLNVPSSRPGQDISSNKQPSPNAASRATFHNPQYAAMATPMIIHKCFVISSHS